eukprot:scpid36378/ scgid11872/ 
MPSCSSMPISNKNDYGTCCMPMQASNTCTEFVMELHPKTAKGTAVTGQWAGLERTAQVQYKLQRQCHVVLVGRGVKSLQPSSTGDFLETHRTNEMRMRARVHSESSISVKRAPHFRQQLACKHKSHDAGLFISMHFISDRAIVWLTGATLDKSFEALRSIWGTPKSSLRCVGVSADQAVLDSGSWSLAGVQTTKCHLKLSTGTWNWK